MVTIDPNGPRRFNATCRALALIWLLVAVAAVRWRGQPPADFSQYYMGGVVARAGAWEALYPVPRPGAEVNASYPDASTMRPAYARLSAERGVGADAYRFMQPPPAALVYLPLGFLPYWEAGWAWLLVMAACGWGVAVLAGRFYEELAGRPTRWAGGLTLLVAAWPRMIATVRWGNVSTAVALCLGLGTLGLLRPRPARAAAAIALGGLIKYATAVLVPVALAMRRWDVLAWLAAWTAAVVGGSLLIMGPGPFFDFFGEIAPTLRRPSLTHGNQSLVGLIHRATGWTPLPTAAVTSVRAAQLAVLALILGLIFTRRPEHWRSPARAFAASAALVAWLVIFSPLYWHHYYTYFCPFWGWLAWEATRSRGRAVAAASAIVLAWVPWGLLFAVSEVMDSYILLSTAIILGLGIARLAAPLGLPMAGGQEPTA